MGGDGTFSCCVFRNPCIQPAPLQFAIKIIFSLVICKNIAYIDTKLYRQIPKKEVLDSLGLSHALMKISVILFRRESPNPN